MEAIKFKAFIESDSQIEELKDFMKSRKIKFEVVKSEEYDPEFVNMVNEGQLEINKRQGVKMSASDFKDLCK